MTDLSDEAKALFEAARAAHEPSDADQRRVFRGVLQGGVLAASTLGASASAAALGGSASAAAAGGAAASGALGGAGLGLAAKLLFGGVLLGSASFGLYRATRPPATPSVHASAAPSTAPSTPSVDVRPLPTRAEPLADTAVGTPSVDAPARPPAVDVAPSNVKRAAPVSTGDATSSARVDAPAAVAPALASASGPASAAFPVEPPASSGPSALTEEARALADVQRALREGRGAQALALLDEQRTKFQGGSLAPERAAARIVALCAIGRVDDARREGARFLETSARSPLAARIRGSCAAP